MYSKLKPGDLLHRSKGIVQHAGVYLGAGLVLHNRPSEGTVVTTYTEYAEGKSVLVTCINSFDQQLLSQRLREIIGDSQSYSLFGNNCEHVAHYLTNGRKISPQVQIALTCGLICGAIGKRNGNFAYGLILGSLTGLVVGNMLKKYDYSICRSEIPA